MKQIIKYLIATILISALLTGNILSLPGDTIPEPDTSNLITFTLFPEVSPFQSDDPMHISLEFDMRKFIREKHRDQYHDAILSIQQEDGTRFEDSIRIRARGVFRMNHCYFPPVKLNFKESEFENNYMNDTKSLKLVTHCKNGDMYQQYICIEYLIYRMLNILTDISFRVRLFEIKYIDSEDRKPSFSKYGFIIESNNHLSARIDAVRVDRDGLATWQTEPHQTNLVTFFQFMIGNTDWAIYNQHNIRLFKTYDHTQLLPLIIPYDFDYCGMVNAYYAIPPEELGIESVRDRLYVGYCLESDEEYQVYIDIFLDRKDKFYSLVENCELLDTKHRKEMLKYLDEFFDIIENPYRFKNEIMNRCRLMPGQ